MDEFRKYIEKDPALERRFQQVLVKEPSVPETISILRGLRERYELHHGVRITDSALVEAAAMSDRYIADRFLPDKAIDLVDEAAAKLQIEITSKPAVLDELDRRVLQLEMEKVSLSKPAGSNKDDRAAVERKKGIERALIHAKEEQADLTARWEAERDVMATLQSIKEEIDRVNIDVLTAEREYDLNRAAELKYGTLNNLQQQLTEAQATLEAAKNDPNRLLREEVTEDDIASVISRWTGIPVNRLQQTERTKLLRLNDELHRRVVGQNEAVDAVADAIQRSRAGLADPNRPIASFLFLGPTGVGKTELGKALAETLFDSETAMIRLDMSEYMEKQAVSRMIGAPPGYVGYEEGGQLTEAVRRRPYSVILFDEVEKAHADVFNVLLQVLDDGRVTDSQGRVVSFQNTIIIMTSNLGSGEILAAEEEGMTPAEVRAGVMRMVRGHFRPEFINRIDEMIVFEPLGRSMLERIVEYQCQRVKKRMWEQKMDLEVTPNALAYLADRGYDPVFGARPVKRVVQKELETAVAKAILEGRFASGDKVVVDAPGGVQAERLVLEGVVGGAGPAVLDEEAGARRGYSQ